MRNDMPSRAPLQNESAIINLDDKNNSGTHWTCYKKIGDEVWYFDSMGNVKPPKELFDYFNLNEIFYNYERYQEPNTFLCGHLCLAFLYNGLQNMNPV